MAQELEYIEGVVAKMSKTGILLEGREKWANYTKEEWRGQPWEHCDKGDTVSLGVSKDFIKTIKLITKGEPQPEGAKGGGRSYGKSPDERASIERQVAVKEVGEALRIGMSVIPEIQAAYWRIVSGWLNAPQSAQDGQGVASASNPIPTGIPQPRTSRDDAEELDRNFEGTVATGKEPPFASKGAFLTAAYEKWGIVASEVGAIITSADMQNLDKAWDKLVERMKGQGNG